MLTTTLKILLHLYVALGGATLLTIAIVLGVSL